jgi:hypothetical protein
VNVLNPKLTGFEIVVASTNNGAVENVTFEIPAAEAIGEAWREEVARTDYFADIATALLGADARPLRTPGNRTSGRGRSSRLDWAISETGDRL